jgi:hypothetical protein
MIMEHHADHDVERKTIQIGAERLKRQQNIAGAKGEWCDSYMPHYFSAEK